MLDRHAIVSRHNPVMTKPDATDVLQVGNGEFAFGMDLTGLQTYYGNTFSQWSWHSYIAPENLHEEELELEQYDTYGRQVGYRSRSKGQEAIYSRLRENPHRMNLGRIGFVSEDRDMGVPDNDSLTGCRQELRLWEGIVDSEFTLDDARLSVTTCAHPELDAVAARISTQSGTIPPIRIAFPYGSPAENGADWEHSDKHKTEVLKKGGQTVLLLRQLEVDSYYVSLLWSGNAELVEESPHVYILRPHGNEIELVCVFAPEISADLLPSFSEVKAAAAAYWSSFWLSGGAIDLSDSTSPQWEELERRIVLSQYVLAVNEAGSLPPQESGLLSNTWYGKFHLEMHWWHGTHFALWNRWPFFERSLHYYQDILDISRERAKEQGYKGARWPKMVGRFRILKNP